MFCADLEDRLVLEQRLERGERVALRDLSFAKLGFRREQIAFCLRRRHRDGRSARSRLRSARRASEKPHRCACIGSRLVVSVSTATTPAFVRARDPFLQPVERAHGLVFAAIDLGRARGLAARGGKRDRGEGAIRLLASVGAACRRRTGRKARSPLAAAARCVGLRARARCSLHPPRPRWRRCRFFGDALRQRLEFHRLEESDQRSCSPARARARSVDRHVERHVLVERDQPLGNARQFGIVDQRLPALVLLDLAGALEQRFEIAVLADQLRRGLDADAGHARHVVR